MMSYQGQHKSMVRGRPSYLGLVVLVDIHLVKVPVNHVPTDNIQLTINSQNIKVGRRCIAGQVFVEVCKPFRDLKSKTQSTVEDKKSPAFTG